MLFFIVVTGITVFGATWKWVAQVPQQLACTYDTDCILAQGYGCGYVCSSAVCVSNSLNNSSSIGYICNGSIWTGQGTSEWGSAGGWNTVVPGPNDTAYIPSAQTYPIIGDAAYSVGTLYIGPNAQLNVSSPGSLTITQSLVNDGSIVVQGGATVTCPTNQTWTDGQCLLMESCTNDVECITNPSFGCGYGCSSSSAIPTHCMPRPNDDPTCGAVSVWTGEQSSQWDTVGNWFGSSVPGAGTAIVIPTAQSTPYLTQNAQASDLTIEPGARLEIAVGVTLTITHALVNEGTIALDAEDSRVVCPNNTIWANGQCEAATCDYDTDCIARSSSGFGCTYGCDAETHFCALRPQGDPTCSADLYWTGSAASQWANASGWENNSAPTSESTVVIPTSFTFCHVSDNAAVKSLTIEPGATLYLDPNAKLTITQSLVNHGNIDTTGGGTVTCPIGQYWTAEQCNVPCRNDVDCLHAPNLGCQYGCSNSSCTSHSAFANGDPVCTAGFVWTGQGASDWSDARPWEHSSPQSLPGPNNSVAIVTSDYDPWLSTSTTLDTLTVMPGATIHLQGQNTKLTVTDSLVNNGTIDMSYGGSVQCPAFGAWHDQQCVSKTCMYDTDCISDARFGCAYGCSYSSGAGTMCRRRSQGDETCGTSLVWTGQSTSGWSDVSGWLNGAAPNAYGDQDVIIPTSPLNPYIDSDIYVSSLTIEPGAVLGIGAGATLHIRTSLENDGTINLNQTASVVCPVGQDWHPDTESCVARSSSSSSSSVVTSSSSFSSSSSLSSSHVSSSPLTAVEPDASNIVIGGNRGDMQPAAERAASIYASQLAQVPPGTPSVRSATESLVSTSNARAESIVTREELDRTLSLLTGETPRHAAASRNASKPVTRADAALLVLRAMDIPIKPIRAGATVQQNAALTAHEYGILRGYDSGALAPDDPVREAHLSILIHRAALVKARLSRKR